MKLVEKKNLLASASLGALLFFAMFMLYRSGIVLPLDLEVSRMAVGMHSEPLSSFIKALSRLNSPPALLLWTLILTGFLLYRRLWRSSLFTVVSIWGTALVTSLVKELVQRARPVERIVEIGSHSFPSWHASTSMALGIALVLLLYDRRGKRALWFLLWPLVIGLSRIYLNAHWASDVLAGWGLGAAVACTVAIVAFPSRR